MAFVNEFIPEEEKGRFQDISIWKDPLRAGLIALYKWTIDRERDAFLIRLGGGGGRPEIPEFFALSWHGEVIKFQAFENRSGNREIGQEISWKIFSIQIPQSLASSRDEIRELIKEAIEALGWNFSRQYIKSVSIEGEGYLIQEESNRTFVNEFIPEAEKDRFKDISIWKNPLNGGPIELYKCGLLTVSEMYF